MNKRIDEAQKEYDFHKGILDKIESAYTGSLSYLNSLEKASFLGALAQNKFANGDTQGYFDTLYAQLDVEKKMSTTKEDYALKFDEYINALQGADQEKTTEDVVERLDDILEQNIRIEDAINRGAFQAPFK
jgi:hypothetical protein